MYIAMLLDKADLFTFNYTPLEEIASREDARINNTHLRTCNKIAHMLRDEASRLLAKLIHQEDSDK